MRIAVSILYVDGCPGLDIARANVEEAAARLGVDVDIEFCLVETLETAQRLGFTGSPTIRVAGRDLVTVADATPRLACRLYATPDGFAPAPTSAQLLAALARTGPAPLPG